MTSRSKVYRTDSGEHSDDVGDEDLAILAKNGFDVNSQQLIGAGLSGGMIFAGVGNERGKRYHRRADGSQWEESFRGLQLAVKYTYIYGELNDESKSELKHLSELKHPNIIDVYDSFVMDDRRLYLVMELATDGDLERYLGRCLEGEETLDARLCLSFVEQLSDGLMYIHDQRVTHGDIQGGNIMVFKNYAKQEESMVGKNERGIVLKYVDFGMSRLVVGEDLGNDLERFTRLLVYLVKCCPHFPDDRRNSLITLESCYSQYRNLRSMIVAYSFLHPTEYSRLSATPAHTRIAPTLPPEPSIAVTAPSIAVTPSSAVDPFSSSFDPYSASLSSNWYSSLLTPSTDSQLAATADPFSSTRTDQFAATTRASDPFSTSWGSFMSPIQSTPQSSRYFAATAAPSADSGLGGSRFASLWSPSTPAVYSSYQSPKTYVAKHTEQPKIFHTLTTTLPIPEPTYPPSTPTPPNTPSESVDIHDDYPVGYHSPQTRSPESAENASFVSMEDWMADMDDYPFSYPPKPIPIDQIQSCPSTPSSPPHDIYDDYPVGYHSPGRNAIPESSSKEDEQPIRYPKAYRRSNRPIRPPSRRSYRHFPGTDRSATPDVRIGIDISSRRSSVSSSDGESARLRTTNFRRGRRGVTGPMFGRRRGVFRAPLEYGYIRSDNFVFD